MTIESAREALDAAQAARAALRAANDTAAREWRAARDKLGGRPQVEPDPKQPTPIPQSRPSADVVTAAGALVASQGAIAETYTRHTAALTKARQDLAEAQDRAVKASVVAGQATAQLHAARRAPEALAEGLAAALGDLGPVRVSFPPRSATAAATDPYLLVDSGDGELRAYGQHSTGERRLVGYALRIGLRRLHRAKFARFVPIGVDEAHSWTGAWPAATGAAVMLVSGVSRG